MSTQEHIYLLSDETPEVLAARLAPLAGLAVTRGDDGGVYLARPARLGPGQVGGEVHRNDIADPGDIMTDDGSLMDAFPMVVDVGYTGRDPDIQLQEGRRLFIDLAATPPVLMAFVRGFDFLLAVADPTIGLVWLPEGTTPYAPDRDRWLRYLPPGERAVSAREGS